MKLLIVSNAPLIKKDKHWYAYSPYVKELEIWAKYAHEVAFCCPEWKEDRGLLIAKIPFAVSKTFLLIDFNIKSLWSAFKAIFQSIYNFITIIKAMYWANHIHLRCPGNVGLLASIAQLFFPHKIKTAKYAGNWDPKAESPFSYRLQKNILSNTFWTHNIKVLVYGKWDESTKNIKPFFTATYKETDKQIVTSKKLNNTIKFVFVGTLTSGKNPLYAIQLIEELINKEFKAELSMYGEGTERAKLESYITNKKLQNRISLFGNQNAVSIQKAYQESHFVILPSQSEGWPKVIAEGMFWGCVPIATSISCVPYMLDYGNRGLLLDIDLVKDTESIQDLIKNDNRYQKLSSNAVEWSRKYTLDAFETEIKLLLQP
jgi:glycosyltransferase involved in cell wall biosynthesis